MGLDMYLLGELRPKRNVTAPKTNRKEDGLDVRNLAVDLGYWRKHPDLHGYIVQTYADGKDDCQPIYLTVEQLEDILRASEADELPHTEGFFFGESQPEDKVDTKSILETAIAWLKAKDVKNRRAVFYQASW